MLKLNAHIEVKENNKWLHYGEFNPNSTSCDNVFLFYAAINGEEIEYLRKSVREAICPQATIEGLPENLSEVTANCHKHTENAYHEGVLTKDNIIGLQKHLYELNERELYYEYTWKLENLFRTTINNDEIVKHIGFDSVRIVFWYTNN